VAVALAVGVAVENTDAVGEAVRDVDVEGDVPNDDVAVVLVVAETLPVTEDDADVEGDGGMHSVPGRYVLRPQLTANVKAYAHVEGSETSVSCVRPSAAHT